MQKNHMMERHTQNMFSRDEIKQKHCGFSICNCKNQEKIKYGTLQPSKTFSFPRRWKKRRILEGCIGFGVFS